MTAEEVALEAFREAVWRCRRARMCRDIERSAGRPALVSLDRAQMLREMHIIRILARIIRAIRAERAERERDLEMSCENTPWPGCECPGCMAARERAMEDA